MSSVWSFACVSRFGPVILEFGQGCNVVVSPKERDRQNRMGSAAVFQEASVFNMNVFASQLLHNGLTDC